MINARMFKNSIHIKNLSKQPKNNNNNNNKREQQTGENNHLFPPRRTEAKLKTISFRFYSKIINELVITKKTSSLLGGESSAGLPRDRQGYSPLYYRGIVTRGKDSLGSISNCFSSPPKLAPLIEGRRSFFRINRLG